MQFEHYHAGYIWWQLTTEGKSLSEILVKEYPEANVYILRGHDMCSDESYNKAASFYEEDIVAVHLLSESFPNGTDKEISDRFYLIQTPLIDIHTCETIDPETGQFLDGIDKTVIYSYLLGSIENRVRN